MERMMGLEPTTFCMAKVRGRLRGRTLIRRASFLHGFSESIGAPLDGAGPGYSPFSHLFRPAISATAPTDRCRSAFSGFAFVAQAAGLRTLVALAARLAIREEVEDEMERADAHVFGPA